jgi:hypothetical protein
MFQTVTLHDKKWLAMTFSITKAIKTGRSSDNIGYGPQYYFLVKLRYNNLSKKAKQFLSKTVVNNSGEICLI